MKSIKRITALLTVLILLCGSAFAADLPGAQIEVFAMDTYMTIGCYGEKCMEALEECKEEILRLDNLLSVGYPNSEITQINKTGSGVLSDDTAVMVEKALDVYETTNGAFDITVYPMMVLWGFTSQNYHVPTAEELSETIKLVNSDALSYNFETKLLTLAPGQGIDLGGIAKGYTSDRLTQIFKKYGIVSAVISLGGNVHCYGTKTDGSKWRIGIVDPNDPNHLYGYMGVLETADRAVITSGAYERYFIDQESGESYHHIIDPATGYPAHSGLTSVTIVSPNGMLADALSTSLYIMGLDRACEYWKASEEEFDVIMMTDDDKVYITEGLEGSFTSNNYKVNVVKR